MTQSDDILRDILNRTRTIAVVGYSAKPDRPSHEVAQFLDAQGYTVIAINPGLAGQTAFGNPICAALSDIPAELGDIHMVDIFRSPDHVGPVVADALSALMDRGLQTIWMQLGVINEDAAAQARAAGLTVIMDRCPKIDHKRLISIN